jgi:hypothetical protein
VSVQGALDAYGCRERVARMLESAATRIANGLEDDSIMTRNLITADCLVVSQRVAHFTGTALPEIRAAHDICK